MTDENSLCLEGLYYHDFRIAEVIELGVVEICTKCHQREFFYHKTSNHEYLSYHLRQALSPAHNRFQKEYASTATAN